MMTDRQLKTQMRVMRVLVEQSVTNFYLAHDSTGHTFYSLSSDIPVFVAGSDSELVSMFTAWCHGTPNEDIDISIAPF